MTRCLRHPNPSFKRYKRLNRTNARRLFRAKLVKRSVKIFMDVGKKESMNNRDRRIVIHLLKLWSSYNDMKGEYGYDKNFYSNLYYCSDRMNSGRARALLRLYREEILNA